MGQFSKKDAIRIVTTCAKKYEENLANKSLLFICMDKENQISSIEFTFDSSNFLHLTGLKLNKRKRHNKSFEQNKQEAFTRHDIYDPEEISALDFYKKCLNHKLKETDFEFADDGTTEMKLEVLQPLMVKNLAAKMIGDYQSDRPKLVTEKLAGGTTACMGFVQNKKSSRLVPNTVLKIDIRQHTASTSRVIACYRKQKSTDTYSEVTYLAKGIDWDLVQYPDGLEYLKDLHGKPDRAN